MKILFVTVPYHCGVVEVAGRWVPQYMVYLAGSARAAGHECVIYDAMTKWHTHEQVVERLAAEKPDVVAVSAITATYLDALEILKNAKKLNPRVLTVMGGVHAHFMFEEVLTQGRDAVDLIVRGEGEEVLVQALEAWQTGADLAAIRGLAFWDPARGRIVDTGVAPYVADLDALPLAYDLLDWSDYTYFVIKDSRLGAVSTSRGCPYGCDFCSQQKFWERSWRARKPEKIVEEIIHQKETYGVNVFLLTDEYPTADRHRWEELLDRLIAADLGVYLLMETRVEDILRDREILTKYRKAGVVHVYLGVEATDQATLDLIKKNIKVEHSAEALRLVREHGMVTETSLVLGFPDDTPESIKRTIELAVHFNPDNAHFLAITPWPYANMYPSLKPYIRDWNYRNYNLIEPIVEPKAMTIKQVNQAMIDGYRRFYSTKMKDFLFEKDPFRRHYLLTAAKLIMGSSFIKTKMKGMKMPPEMLEKARRAHEEFEEPADVVVPGRS